MSSKGGIAKAYKADYQVIDVGVSRAFQDGDLTTLCSLPHLLLVHMQEFIR